MKTELIIIVILVSSLNSFSQNRYLDKFTLIGKINGRDTGLIQLDYINKYNKQVHDTDHIKEGNFTFKGLIDAPTLATLIGDTKVLSRQNPNITQIFLEPNTMMISVTEREFKQAVMKGSYSQKQWDTLQHNLLPILNKLKPLDSEYTELKRLRAKGDISNDFRDRLLQQRNNITPYLRSLDSIFYKFVHSHPNSFVSAYILSDFVNINKLPSDSAKEYYSKLGSTVKNSQPGRAIYKELQAEKIFLENRSTVGSVAPTFKMKDINGDTVNLLSFRGENYVLLDFWASWCPPCIKAIPQLKYIYKEFHKKGLDIISLSWDYHRQAWINEIRQQGTNLWYNIYLDEGDDNDIDFISEKYGIYAIPTFVLIDKNGKIIGKYYSNNQLQDLNYMLKKLFLGNG